MKGALIVMMIIVLLLLIGLIVVSGIFLAEFALGNIGISGKIVWTEKGKNSTNYFENYGE